MSYLVQHGLAKTWIFVVGAIMLAGTFSNRVVAQNSWTWGAVGGGNGDMGNPLNWQPNGVPDFGAVNGLDSLTFSTSSNTTVSMTDDSAGDQVQDITFDASAPAYSFTTFPDHTDNNFTIRGTLLNQSLNTQYFPGTTDLYISSGGALNAASGNQSTHLSLDLGGGFIHGSGGNGVELARKP